MLPDRGHTWTEPELGGSPHLQHTEVHLLRSTYLCIQVAGWGQGPALIRAERRAPAGEGPHCPQRSVLHRPLKVTGEAYRFLAGTGAPQRGSFPMASLLPGV